MRKADPGSLLENKRVLFHARDWVEVAEINFARIKHPTINPQEIFRTSQAKQILRRDTNLLVNIVAETCWAIIMSLCRRQIFEALIENFAVFFQNFNFRWHQRNWFDVWILQDNNCEFFAFTNRFYQ